MALPMLRDLNADILLTDIRMPFMDGMKLCEEVQRTMPWVERIILSGYDDFSYAQKAISLGVKEYLLKPVTASGTGGGAGPGQPADRGKTPGPGKPDRAAGTPVLRQPVPAGQAAGLPVYRRGGQRG